MTEVRVVAGRAWLMGLAAVSAVLLAGCSGGTSSRTLEGDSQGAAAGAQALPGSGVRAPATGAATSSAPVATNRAKIRTAELSVIVGSAQLLDDRADRAVSLAERAGGDVAADDRDGGTHPTASLQLQVPPAALDATLRDIAHLGKVTSREVSVRDVTGQVTDVDSRVDSAQRAIARLRTLYATAGRVTDVIAVEQQLSAREADLESLQAQQRTLNGHTSLATIRLQLRVASAPPAPSEDRGGFVGGLSQGWDAFVGFLGGLARGLGTALPFLGLLAVLLLAARPIWRRTHRRAPAPAAE